MDTLGLRLTKKVREYHDDGDKWTRVRTNPTRVTIGNGHAVAVGDERHFAGVDINSNATTQHDVYNAATDTWTYRTLPSGVRYTYQGLLNGMYHVVSGEQGVHWAFDPATLTYTSKLAPATTDWRFGASFVINNLLYLCGTYSSGGVAGLSVQSYDPVSNTYTARASLPSGNKGPAGGTIDGYGYYVSRSGVHKYDPGANIWTTLASLGVGNDMPNAHAVVAGRFIYCDNATNGPRMYDPATNTWEQGAYPPQEWSLSVGMELPDNRFGVPAYSRASDGIAMAIFETYTPRYLVPETVDQLERHLKLT